MISVTYAKQSAKRHPVAPPLSAAVDCAYGSILFAEIQLSHQHDANALLTGA